MNLFSLLLPLAIELIKGYIRSSDSKKDDLVLDIVKESVCYLGVKDNNNVDITTANNLLTKKIIKDLNNE